MEPLTADDPRQVSVFRLQSRLGAGGMGRVYLATSPGGRAVAVKVVHPELARDPEFMRRFRREVEAAEAVSGVYTAPVVGAGPDDSPPWLATAYVPGPSLSELVAGAGPLPEAAAWRLAGGLVEALQAIHGRGLVHRDLKPGNILIAADGPRVIDFGISRALHGIALTATHMTMGTPAYMSPEQAEGREIGPASDVFSLGSVLAFAATGNSPVRRRRHDVGHLPDRARGSGPPLASARAWRHRLRVPGQGPGEPAVAGRAARRRHRRCRVPPGERARAVLAGPGGRGNRRAGRPAPERTAGAAYVTPAAPPVTYYPADQPGATAPPAQEPGTAPGRRSSRRWLLAIAGAGVLAAAVGAALALVLAPGPANSTGASGQAPPSRSAAATTPAAATTAAAASSPPASSPATSAPATSAPASPSNSLIAVTVCIYPADGCTLPGAAQYMEVRPKQITNSGDGSGYVKDLVWSNWGGPQATATGTQESR